MSSGKRCNPCGCGVCVCVVVDFADAKKVFLSTVCLRISPGTPIQILLLPPTTRPHHTTTQCPSSAPPSHQTRLNYAVPRHTSCPVTDPQHKVWKSRECDTFSTDAKPVFGPWCACASLQGPHPKLLCSLPPPRLSSAQHPSCTPSLIPAHWPQLFCPKPHPAQFRSPGNAIPSAPTDTNSLTVDGSQATWCIGTLVSVLVNTV